MNRKPFGKRLIDGMAEGLNALKKSAALPEKAQALTIDKEKMSPFAQELLQSMQETVAYLKGEGTATVTRLRSCPIRRPK